MSQQFKTRSLQSHIHEVTWSLFLHGNNSFDSLNEVNKKGSQENLHNETIIPNYSSFTVLHRSTAYKNVQGNDSCTQPRR